MDSGVVSFPEGCPFKYIPLEWLDLAFFGSFVEEAGVGDGLPAPAAATVGMAAIICWNKSFWFCIFVFDRFDLGLLLHLGQFLASCCLLCLWLGFKHQQKGFVSHFPLLVCCDGLLFSFPSVHDGFVLFILVVFWWGLLFWIRLPSDIIMFLLRIVPGWIWQLSDP